MAEKDVPWWRGAVIYQVYVRSFCDGNGDGQGDFAGLISKLDYIASLGVDAIWLSPIHPSPNRDWGYDVSDYEGVHPDYGTLADFDALVERGACARPEDHPRRGAGAYLRRACLVRRQPRRRWRPRTDWYVWADPKDDGTVPNNWLSVFGGPAWAYQPARRQYYHHKFLRQQPKLNWVNTDAREAALKVLDLWLERGVDGFRLDVANAYLHDADADATIPPIPPASADVRGMGGRRQHAAPSPRLQSGREQGGAGRDPPPGRALSTTASCSANSPRSSNVPAAYLPPDKGLHAATISRCCRRATLAADSARIWKRWRALSRSLACIRFSNHDVIRTATASAADAAMALAKVMLALLSVAARHGAALSGRGTGPAGSRSAPRSAARSGGRSLLSRSSRAATAAARRCPGMPTRPISASRPARPGCRWARRTAARGVGAGRRPRTRRSPSRAPFWHSVGRALRCALARSHCSMRPRRLLAFTRTHDDERMLCVFNMSGEE